MGTTRGTLVVLMALALAAAACGDDSSDVSADSTTTTTVASEPSEPVDSAAPPVPEDLPASFRGVTETTIKVGVAVPDFDALQAAGIPNYQGDANIAFQAFFDVINADGGIHGRQIEPVYVPFDFLDPASQDVACAELTGDHEVFIVLYGLLTENNLCLTELNDTMVMTRSFQTSNLRERSGDTLWLQLNASDDARVRILADTLAESGRLEGKTIGILAAQSQDDGLEGQVLEERLKELGFDSTLLVTTASQADAVERDRELGVFAERYKLEGVDFLFDLWGGGDIAGLLAESGFTPELAYKALGASVDGASDRARLDGAVGVGERNEQSMFDDPEFQAECMDVVRAANPELVEDMSFLPTGDEQAAGQKSWLNPIMIACDQTMLLDMIGEIAGAELTNESFRAALDELGPVTLHGYGQASFNSESKWDGLDEFSLQQYDFASDSIEVVGDPIIVDR